MFKPILLYICLMSILPLSANAEVRYFDSPNDIAQFILEKSKVKDFKAILEVSALSSSIDERMPFLEYGKTLNLISIDNDCDLIEKNRFSSELAKASDVEKAFTSLGCTLKESTMESYIQLVLNHSIVNVHDIYTSLYKLSQLNINKLTKLAGIQSDLSSDLYSGQYTFTYGYNAYPTFVIKTMIIKHPKKGFTFFHLYVDP